MKIAWAPKSFREWILRIIPISALVVITSIGAGFLVGRPHRRTIKLAVLLFILTMMWRFGMIYSLYFFIILFPFPSGVSLNNTNVILLTIITLIWMIRAQSSNLKLFKRTEIDKFILVFITAYVLSFINVEDRQTLIYSLQILWRELSAIALFYLIVRFISDERKLEGITKLVAFSAGLLALTGVIELLLPGRELIPGWLGFHTPSGLKAQVSGIRLGGAAQSHSVLSDYCSLTLFFMGLHFLRSKNAIQKFLWLAIAVMAFTVLLATANRGAFVALVVGICYLLYLFRSRLNIVQYVLIGTLLVSIFLAGQIMLDKYTYAVSITQRMTGTEFQGIVPDTRIATWVPALEKATEHIFLGHGPYFNIIFEGMESNLWPHNAYIYYLCTIGLFGLIPFLLILYILIRISLRHKSPAASGTFAGLIMKILHVNFIMFLIEQTRTDHQRNGDFIYPYIVWIFFGLIVATGNLIKEREMKLEESSGSEAGET